MIDWQQELCQPPFNQYNANWFSELLSDPAWKDLCLSLNDLHIVFPAAHSPNRYVCLWTSRIVP